MKVIAAISALYAAARKKEPVALWGALGNLLLTSGTAIAATKTDVAGTHGWVEFGFVLGVPIIGAAATYFQRQNVDSPATVESKIRTVVIRAENERIASKMEARAEGFEKGQQRALQSVADKRKEAAKKGVANRVAKLAAATDSEADPEPIIESPAPSKKPKTKRRSATKRKSPTPPPKKTSKAKK